MIQLCHISTILFIFTERNSDVSHYKQSKCLTHHSFSLSEDEQVVRNVSYVLFHGLEVILGPMKTLLSPRGRAGQEGAGEGYTNWYNRNQLKRYILHTQNLQEIYP